MARTPNRVTVAWAGEERFDAGRPGGPRLRLDGRGETGQSPVDALLSALAACTSIDVASILTKRRTPPDSLEIDVVGHRADAVPPRVTRIELLYRLRGAALDRANTERAIELALTKYCSVRDTLDPALPIEWTLELNGERGEMRR